MKKLITTFLMLVSINVMADAVQLGTTGADVGKLIADFIMVPGSTTLASKKNIHAKCPANSTLYVWTRVSSAPAGVTKLIGNYTTLANWTTDLLIPSPGAITFRVTGQNEGVFSIARADTIVGNASVRTVLWCQDVTTNAIIGFQIPNGSPIDLTKGTFNRY
jgi:hypothetical protein